MVSSTAYLIPGMKYKKRNGSPDQDKMNKIINNICQYFDYDRETLMSRKRTDDLVYARHWCIWFILANTRIKTKALGELMNGRDHTTILYARDMITGQLELDCDNYYKEDFDVLKNCVLNGIIDKTGRPFKKSGSRISIKAIRTKPPVLKPKEQKKEELVRTAAIYSNKQWT